MLASERFHVARSQGVKQQASLVVLERGRNTAA